MDSPEKNASIEFETAEKLILRWDDKASERMIFDGDHRQEADQYLRAVDKILQKYSMDSSATVSTNNHSIPSKIHNLAIIQIAMARLQDEFRNILITHFNSIDTEVDMLICPNSPSNSTISCSTESSADFKTTLSQFTQEGYLEDEEHEECSNISNPSTNSLGVIDLILWEAIYCIRSIAERMITAGYLDEFIQVYVSVRKPIMDARFLRLGIEKLGIDMDHVQMLEWIRAAKGCVHLLFAGEKRLCQQIFEGQGLGTIVATNTCFMETVKDSMIQLFNFPETISIRSSVELSIILDLHRTLTDFLTYVNVVFFGSNLSEYVRVEADVIVSSLAKAAKGALLEFVNNMVHSVGRITPIPGGNIHPLTRYVMNSIVCLISDYSETLMELIVSNPSTDSLLSGDPTAPEIDFTDQENQSPLGLHLIWIIEILQFNLESKSKFYKDASLSHIFLMNNIYYIIHKVEGSPEIFKMIGNDYLKRNLKSKLWQEAMNYERSTWARILCCLSSEGLHVGNKGLVSMRVLKERFKTFNSMFEEVHRVQATWLIHDPQVREELRMSISGKLIPSYRSFLSRYCSHIKRWNLPKMNIKYLGDDLEIAVLDFFQG